MRTTRRTPACAFKTSYLQLRILEDRSMPSISGIVFQDYNANGELDLAGAIANNSQGTTPTAVDRGIAGVTVSAYDAANALVAQALSDALGNYVLNPTASGPIRVEFTGLPTGVFFGPQGTTTGSAIQFVTSSNQANVNLSVVRPEDFSPNNPTLVTSAYVVGGIENYDLNPGSGVILSFPYSSGSSDTDPNRGNHQNPTTHELSVAQREVGVTWGLAYDPNTGRLFAAAYMKRTSGFGPGGPGAIYSVPTTGTTADLFADLNAIYGDSPAGNLQSVFTDSNGNAVPFRQNYDEASDWFFDGLVRFTDQNGVVRDLGWDAVGKIALGGLDVNAEGSRMFTLALGDRRLYSLPTSGALTTGTVQRFDLPVPTSVTGVTAANPLGDLRPFAVEWHRGLVYIGAVNSAESTQNSADLRAYVFAFDPATGQFVDASRRVTTNAAVFEFALNYDRGILHVGRDPDAESPGGFTPADPAEWNPWSPITRVLQVQPESLGRSGYPQPMLTGLSFDSSGNLLIGLRDRSGDQIGRNVPIYADELNNYSYFSITAGDTLRAFINSRGSLDVPSAPLAGWTLESNARSPGGLGAGPQNNGQGPGGGEFFFDDDFPHDPNVPPVGYVGPENDEVSVGGVLHIPGFPQALTTNFDPIRIPGAVDGGGIRWYDSATGRVSKTYELYVTPRASSTSTFAKGNGIGDLVAITAPPPIEIGNYVWNDTNKNGIQDAGESAVANVRLDLYSNNVLIASATTDGNGNYIFSSGVGSSTTSRAYNLGLMPNTAYEIRVDRSQTSLSGLAFTIANADGSFNGTARDSNVGADGVISVVTPPRGVSNHSFDVGLIPGGIIVPPPPPPPLTIPASVSGYVFRDDCPVDGIREIARNETGFAGVRITIIGDTIEGPITRNTITDANGFYQFTSLPPGTYTITETQPQGFYDGPDTPGNLGGTSPSNDVLQVTLAEADIGTEYNFAEVAPNAVFGYVFIDANRNRVYDQNESGISGVAVTISGTAFSGTALARPLTAEDALGSLTTITDRSGRWEFPLLPPGEYTIREAQPADYLDYFETVQEPTVQPVVVGNDFFSSVGLCGGETRGQLNFGELPTSNPQQPSKGDFLGSTGSGASQSPSTTPPISATPEDVPLNPAFTVSTATPTYVVVGADAGHSPLLRVFDYSSGVERYRFYAYEQNYLGGVRVATADVDGDGVPDIIAATGQGGGPRVRVFSGANREIIRDFFAYEPEFRGGVFVAAADVNGDGKADIITGTELGGGPRVTVFDGATNARIQDFFAFESSQRGGVRVAAADFTGDGKAEIVTTAGRGVQTRVRVFDAASRTVLTDFIPYDARFTGGVYITAGDITGDGIADIVTSADVGGGPHVQVFNGLTGKAAYGFFSDEADFRGGVRVALHDLDGDGDDEIITANGAGAPSRVRIYMNGATTPFEEFYAFDTSYTGGIYVG